MIIHLHCFAWNDLALLPHFILQHQRWVDHIHVWDLQSTDGSEAWLRTQTKTTLHHYEAKGSSLIDTQRQRFDDVWRISRGHADWVVLLNADEHLHHPNLREYLVRRRDDGVTAIKAIGYEMVSNLAPSDLDPALPLTQQVTQGCRSPGLDRLTMFAPGSVTATNFAPGQHHAWPEGHVVWPAEPQALLLRFQVLGQSHFVQQCQQRAAALLPDDRAQGWGAHLAWTAEALQDHMTRLRSRAHTVPGLGDLANLQPAEYRRHESVVEASGLFDADWYETHNPDIAAHQFDPLTHFCEYGWREGRQPNPYFDLAWYAQQCGEALGPDHNPLLHYIQTGELLGLQPSPHFEPAWYQTTHGLGGRDGALRHYLQHRLSGMVSPISAFDVEAYVAKHPELADSGRDPYFHFLAHRQPDLPLPQASAVAAMTAAVATAGAAPAVAPQPTEPVPRWDDVWALVQRHEPDNIASPTVPASAVEAAVRPFLAWLPFDATWYLQANPDVAKALADGAFASAHAHFLEHGYFEGRAPTPGSP